MYRFIYRIIYFIYNVYLYNAHCFLDQFCLGSRTCVCVCGWPVGRLARASSRICYIVEEM